MPTPGLTFSPTQQGGTDPKQETNNPVQSAIQLLSYRLPQTVGAGAIAPRQLLSGVGALGSQIGGSVAEQWLRKLFMGDLGGQPGMPSAPMMSPMGGGMGGSNPFMNWLGNEGAMNHGATQMPPPSRGQGTNWTYGEGPSQGGGQTLPDQPPAPEPQPSFAAGAGGRKITWGG